MEKGTTNGTLTDVDGKFNLKVKPGATIVVSYIGYETQEIKVGNQSSIRVKLQDEGNLLNEVVAIGYGTQRKESVTGSVASVSADKLMENPSSNITQALQNRIAGVDMQQTNSQPGAEMQIRIRGQRSLSASNDPLIVLDGIPFLGNLSDINPSDIKSLDILKDASATAIYGSRGANGVILITTNKGALESPAKVTYNGYVSIKTLFNKYPMMEGEKYTQMRALAGKFGNGIDEHDGNNTDWQDLFYQTGISHNHNLTVSGGTSSGTYSFGGGYIHDEGVIPTQAFDRITLRANIEQKVGNYLKLGLSTTNSYNKRNGMQLGMYGILQMTPLVDPNNLADPTGRVARMSSDDVWFITKDRIKDNEETWLQHNTSLGTYNTIFAEVSCPWVDGLKYRVNLGLNYRNNKIGGFTGTGINTVNATELNSASVQQSEYKNYAVENILSYDKTFGKHTINAVGLYSVEQTRYDQHHLGSRGVPEYFQYYNIGAGKQDVTVNPNYQNYWQAGLMSWMGRVMYSYDSKYMISAAVRSDASSRLAKGHQWHTYPAVSLGWNIAREKFMEDVTWVDNLKLRAGYGQTANQAISPYTTLGTLGTTHYNFGDLGTPSYETGYYISKLPNPQLGWEYSETYNFGLDFSLFHGRLSGTLEYYVQKTNDILLNVSLPSTSGVGSYTANIGKTQNKGFEATINGIIIENKNGWTWEAGVNLAMNRNKLVELADGSDQDEANGWFKGHPIDVLYDYEKVGLWNAGDEDWDVFQTLEPGGNEGMIKVKYEKRYDKDGKLQAIGPDDRQIISLEPKFVGGFNTRLAYKNFDLNVIGAFQCGGKLISTLYSSTGYLNMLTGRRGQVDVDYWTEDNKGAKYPKPGGIQSGDNPKYGSTLGIFDGSYVKIRTISLGYNFSGDWMKRAGIEALRLYATVQNPFIIYSPYHKESGLDPEPNSMSNQGQFHATQMGGHALPVVGTNAPTTRNYLLGLNVTLGGKQKVKSQGAQVIEKVVEKVVEKPVVKEVVKEVVKKENIQNTYVVTFEVNSYQIANTAELAGIASGSNVEVVAYASPEGNADANIALSQKRADAVADYLKSKGINVTRVEAKGADTEHANRIAIVTIK
ncbi:MAG: SusC/RagA family TonB-linked outer membrane protein [Prevotella sp.]|nr:SusC/RagA family TonB-linked outer membrane protein [Prevotella sp.]